MVAPSLDENVGTLTGPVSRSASWPVSTKYYCLCYSNSYYYSYYKFQKNHETSKVGTVQPRQSVWYNLNSRCGISRRPALFHAVLVCIN